MFRGKKYIAKSRRREESGCVPSALRHDAIDFSRYFMPERLTPLYHTPCYERLTELQRRCYNQLQAAYLNEQTIFFESVMARPILRSYRRERLTPELADALPKFMAEEAAHSAMFRGLNQRVWPGIYAAGDFHFIAVSPMIRAALGAWVRNANRFPLFLWLLMIQEERAMHAAKVFLSTDGLEPQFVAAQRAHLADEAGHVRWDEKLLAWFWPRSSPAWQRINVRLFGWLMHEYFTVPRRSGLRVVVALVKAFPELRDFWPELSHEMMNLWRVRAFQEVSYSREVTPCTFAHFDCAPEFSEIGRMLSCYEAAPAAIYKSAASGSFEPLTDTN